MEACARCDVLLIVSCCVSHPPLAQSSAARATFARNMSRRRPVTRQSTASVVSAAKTDDSANDDEDMLSPPEDSERYQRYPFRIESFAKTDDVRNSSKRQLTTDSLRCAGSTRRGSWPSSSLVARQWPSSLIMRPCSDFQHASTTTWALSRPWRSVGQPIARLTATDLSRRPDAASSRWTVQTASSCSLACRASAQPALRHVQYVAETSRS